MITQRIHHLTAGLLLLVSLFHENISYAQEYVYSQPDCDSVVVEHPNGDCEVSYVFKARPAEIFAVPKQSTLKRAKVKASRQSPVINSVKRDLSQYSVGSIPIQSSVSPTGARIYSIPISVAPGWKLVPSIALTYNSQGGDNVAGFGWGISGISSIDVRNKNYYYDGEYKGMVYDSPDAEYSLDGVPIVRSSMGVSGYTHATARGNIQVQKHYASSGVVAYFTVLYPNGSVGTFGYENNKFAKCSYPLTRLKDIDGNTIIFSYTETGGNSYYLKKVSYGKDSIIELNWVSNPDKTPYLFSVKGDGRDYPILLLKSIICKDGDDVLYTYSLKHEIKDDVSLLREVGCSSSLGTLPPISFMYGVDSDDASYYSPQFYMTNESLFMKYFTKSDDVSLIYKRGKFIPGSINDGVVILPSYETYASLGYTHKWYETHRSYKYGSKYSAEQEILCNVGGYLSSKQETILAGEGFQLIEAIDVNGDGVDELVKVNNGSTTSGVTDFMVSIYFYSTQGVMSVESFKFSVDDGSSNKYYNNPAKCYYRFGNFRGDGCPLMLIMTQESSKFVLVDLAKKRKISERSLFSMNDDESRLVLVADFENDGKADLCHVTADGLDVYSVSDLTGTGFSKRITYTGLSKHLLCMDLNTTVNGVPQDLPCNIEVLDINGDGYQDLVSYPLPYTVKDGKHTLPAGVWTINISRFNGKRFWTDNDKYFSRKEGDIFVFLDVDKDGLPDILHSYGPEVVFYKNVNGRFQKEESNANITLDTASDLIPGDISIYGTHGDVMVASGPYIRLYSFGVDHGRNRRLTNMTDSYGRVNINDYSNLMDVDGAYYTDLSRTYSASSGFMRSRIPLTVLSDSKTVYVDRTFEDYRYTYFDAVYHNRGLGFCGFGKIRATDRVNNSWSEQTFDPERMGVVIKATAYKGESNTPFSTTVNTYDNNSTYYGKLNPRLTKSVATDGLTGIETITTYTYGKYDFPTSVLTRRRKGEDGVYLTERLERVYQHSVTASKYVLGMVTDEFVVKDGRRDLNSAWKERSVTTYNDKCRPLTSKKYVGSCPPLSTVNTAAFKVLGTGPESEDIIDIDLPEPPIEPEDPTEPGEPEDPTDPEPIIPDEPEEPVNNESGWGNLVSETHWEYNEHGNVMSEKTASYGATEFIGNTYTYDADGRYLESETDAFGHTTTYGDYDKYGRVKTITDYHGRVKTIAYAGLNSRVKTEYADGAVELTSTAWGGVGLYMVTNTTTGAPESVTHYDILGREVRSGVKRFDGQWQWVDKEYDHKGRLNRVSLPYRGSAAIYWNTYEYDDYDRPINLLEASGKVNSWSYDGTKITTIKDGIRSSKSTDACGNVTSAQDDGGPISYALRDDGQCESIRVFGGDEIDFTYDDYGRRIKIENPSAGVQTDEYVWNSDGSSKSTHTNPNGQVITYCDKYGRTTLVERPGEYNSTYIYDEYGRLSSEQSTNGTGIEYTYDEFDRVAMTREVVPDGKWLRKDYTYAPGGILASVKYTAQSGEITTETYTYANGYNIGINLPDGTAVWSMVSENDLGAATEVLTGDISREYGFTDFGLPAYRRMDDGRLQNFVYQFDPMTGNLMSRKNVISDQTETFGYDNLNRLASMDERQISYDKNGNIKAMGGVGTMRYSKKQTPYRILSLTPEEDGLVPNRPQNIAYTCYSRPSILKEGGRSAAFTYDGDGDRVKMYVANGAAQVLTRYYIGARYEYDQTQGGTKERLYLGGDAYSAPIVYEREDNGDWNLYNIGRDYLGSITHIATIDGNLIAEYSYDPWGRLRNPETLEIYAPGTEHELFLGRGYTGHEHLTWFGLINMNARLYDPLLGRFLSPDPYVQAPDFTQNFNRYSYALNNPLKYTDVTGEFFTWSVGASGFSLGINFTPIGIPIGFGVRFGTEGSLGVYGELGYRVGGTGLGAGETATYSYDYNFSNGRGISSFSIGAYASFGGFSVSANASWSSGNWGWCVGAGIGDGDVISGAGLYINYGSSGWGMNAGGYYDSSRAIAFSRGCQELGVAEGEPLSATDEVLKAMQMEWYPDAPMDYIVDFSVEKVPLNAQLLLESKTVDANALTLPRTIKGKVTGRCSVFFSRSAFSSAKQLYITMGHEFVHVSNYITAAGMNFDRAIIVSENFMNMTEFWAYSFQQDLTKSTLSSFDRTQITSFMNSFGSEVVDAFSYRHMKWYITRKLWK